MSSSMAFISSTTPTNLPSFSSSSKTHFPINPFLSLKPQSRLLFVPVRATENGSGSAIVVEEKKDFETKEDPIGNGAPVAGVVEEVVAFEDPKWVSGTWDLKQFEKMVILVGMLLLMLRLKGENGLKTIRNLPTMTSCSFRYLHYSLVGVD